MIIAKEPIRCKLVADRKPIEQVMKLEYLHAQITSDHNTILKVHNQFMYKSQNF